MLLLVVIYQRLFFIQINPQYVSNVWCRFILVQPVGVPVTLFAKMVETDVLSFEVKVVLPLAAVFFS